MEPLHRLLGWVQPAPRGWIWGVPGAAGTTARLRPSPAPVDAPSGLTVPAIVRWERQLGRIVLAAPHSPRPLPGRRRVPARPPAPSLAPCGQAGERDDLPGRASQLFRNSSPPPPPATRPRTQPGALRPTPRPPPRGGDSLPGHLDCRQNECDRHGTHRGLARRPPPAGRSAALGRGRGRGKERGDSGAGLGAGGSAEPQAPQGGGRAPFTCGSGCSAIPSRPRPG